MSFLRQGPLAFAHRGGAGLPANAGIENSLEAFSNAINLGYEYLETDVRASRDGVVYVFHDADLARVVGKNVMLGDLDSEQIDQMKLAGGAPIPRLEDLLSSFGDARLNIDIKSDDAVVPTLKVLQEAKARDRILIAGFSHRRLQQVRKLMPGVATSASPREVVAWVRGIGKVRSVARRNGAVCFQVPLRARGIQIISPKNVARANQMGLQVHVWTIDDAAQMEQLFDIGVDGIVTDRPDVLKTVLQERGQW